MAVQVSKPGEPAQTPTSEPIASNGAVASDGTSAPSAPTSSAPTASSDGEEVLNVTPPEVVQATQTPPASEDKVRSWIPTAQQIALGGNFTNIDMRLHNVQVVRVPGLPTVQQVQVVKKVKVPGTPGVAAQDAITSADGTVITPAVAAVAEVTETTKEVTETVNQVTYQWDYSKKENVGDPFPSLTAALVAQKGMAKVYEKEGMTVKEFLSKEYGVWYVQDPEGKKQGWRYTVEPVAAPAKPVKVKEADPEKEAARAKAAQEREAKKKEREEAKVAKQKAKDDAKAAKASTATPTAVAAEAAVAASDPVHVEIAE